MKSTTPSQAAARDYWQQRAPRVDRKPRPEQPVCLLMAGVPLAGKTTLARRLVEAIDQAAVHVENDRLRPRVTERLGREEPVFSGDENHATYQAAREVLEQALEAGFHVVHDATNLDESDRRPAYELADTLEAPVRVLFVQAPCEVRRSRAEEAGPAARQAHEALGDRQPSPEACSREHRVLDGTREVDSLVDEVLADGAFAALVGS